MCVINKNWDCIDYLRVSLQNFKNHPLSIYYHDYILSSDTRIKHGITDTLELL